MHPDHGSDRVKEGSRKQGPLVRPVLLEDVPALVDQVTGSGELLLVSGDVSRRRGRGCPLMDRYGQTSLTPGTATGRRLGRERGPVGCDGREPLRVAPFSTLSTPGKGKDVSRSGTYLVVTFRTTLDPVTRVLPHNSNKEKRP